MEKMFINKDFREKFENQVQGYLNFKSLSLKFCDSNIASAAYEWQKKNFEGQDVYISDGGIYFASWLDNDLKKKYPSLPISYALWRHLYNSSLHVNTQVFSRLWLVLREQAEFVVSCQKCIKLPLYMYLTVCTYTRWEDAEQGLRPLKPPLFGRKSKGAPITVENSARGEIKQYSLLVPKKWLTYDSRAFHEKVFGYKAPKKQRKPRRLKQKSNP